MYTATPAGSTLPMGYRQGTIVAWDPVTLANKVRVGGEGGPIFTDLIVMGLAEAASYAPGVVVGIAVVESSWAIIGRFVVPNTADAEDAITQLGQRRQTATVATSQSTMSDTFTDLATPGPSVANVRIPASGKVEVTVSAEINGIFAAVGVDISGAFTEAATTSKALIVFDGVISSSRVLLYEGLPAGELCTFTLKYRTTLPNTAQFASRDIIVEAL